MSDQFSCNFLTWIIRSEEKKYSEDKKQEERD